MSAGSSTAYQRISAFVFSAISAAYGHCLFKTAVASGERFSKSFAFAASFLLFCDNPNGRLSDL